ncbi:uncharacterized protein LOC119598352 [Penaeus monodon]|uniref:uncharacterized protein LOC119598352 n=1 Tax=Penaeus monodon TaxID=6687 RepID=UPI0018A7A5DB|nr:uncharacterized protein LOC119598352 [Penaeus monodon]
MFCGLHAVLFAIWETGTIPPDWKRGLIIPIWKGQGDQRGCGNYRGITLLSIQKSTVDCVLAFRVLVECRPEFQQGMLVAYVDLKKAFDSMHRESLWSLLGLCGIPPGIIGLLSDLYRNTENAV